MTAHYKNSRFTLVLLVLALLVLGPVGAAWAQVTVTAADPSSAAQGTISLDVAISGSGFDSSAAVKFLVTGSTSETGGITVKKVSVRGSKKLIATIDVADTAVVNRFDIEVTLSGDRKGKGTTLFTVTAKTNGSDPCAAPGLDFPAFVFWKPAGTTVQSFVADATGTCSRPLYLATDGYSPYNSSSFSYPVDGSENRGRLVWREGNQLVGGDFTVSGTTVTVEPRRTILAPVGCCAVDLSADGRHLYVSTADDTLKKVAVADTANPSVIKVLSDDGWFQDVSVNGDESFVYVEEYRMSGNQTGARELIRIDLETLDSTLLVPDNISPYWPAADLGSDQIAYTYYPPGSDNCYLLQVADGTTGMTISIGTPRYGRDWSWYDGKILGFGYSATPSKRGLRCQSKDMITEIDPLTSAERDLVRGYYHDGR